MMSHAYESKGRPTTADLHARVKLIAAELGWTYNEQRSYIAEGKLHGRALIDDNDGGSYSFSHRVDGGRDRLVVSADAPHWLPDGTRFALPYEFKSASASFAWDRTVAQVARAVKVKLADNARAIRAHYEVAADEQQKTRERHEHAINTLAAVPGVRVHHDRRELEAHFSLCHMDGGPYVRGRVFRGQVSLDASSMDGDTAAKMLRAVAR